jgi:hypothetical protein
MRLEKENTSRVIKGQDPIQRFRCYRLDWHRWTTWSVIEEDWNAGRMGARLRCHCVDCGRVRFESPYSKTFKKNE